MPAHQRSPLLACLLATFCAAAPVAAQSLVFGLNQPIAASAGAPRNERPRVACTDDGVAHVVWARGEIEHEGLFVAASPAGGSYGASQMISPSLGGVATGGGSGPTLRAAGGFLVAGWEDRYIPNRAILAVRSTDRGASWEPALRADPATAENRNFQAAGIFPDGRIAQSWMAYHGGLLDPGFDWTAQDGTGLFAPPIEATAAAAGEACSCCYPDQLVLDDGVTVLVAFRNNENNVREIHVARSTDGGATFASEQRIDTSGWTLQGCPSTGPSLAAAGPMVLAAWKAVVDNQAHIWMARSADSGASWSPMQQVDDGDGTTLINYPQITLRGQLAVAVWEGTGAGGMPGIFAAASLDAGQSWGASVEVTDDAGPALQTQASVAIFPDLEIEVVWRDSRLDAPRLFHARGQASQVGVAGATPRLAPPAARLLPPAPNPVRASTRIAFELPHAGHVRLALYDATGRRRALLVDGFLTAGTHRLFWSGGGGRDRRLAAGSYVLRLEAAGQTSRRKLTVLP